MRMRFCCTAVRRKWVSSAKFLIDKAFWYVIVCLIMTVVYSYLVNYNSYSVASNAAGQLRFLEQHSSYKLFLEEPDGGINLVFHLPASSDLNKALRQAKHFQMNVSSTPTTSEKRAVTQFQKSVDISASTKTESVHSTQDKDNNKNGIYPLSTNANPYHLNSPNICKDVDKLAFVVIVHTATTNFMNRHSIRETWANANLFTNQSIRIAFLLGKPDKDSTQVLIEHEQLLHKDIVQGDFLDSYHNLTHKGVLGLRWVSEFCTHARAVVKVDDDVFLNVFQMMDEVVTNYSKTRRTILCSVRGKGTSPIMRSKGKWKVEERDFFNMTHYPVTYCNGFFVLMTMDIVSEMYAAARSIPFFWVDDVYLFGLLPDAIGNVTYTHRQNLNLNEKKSIACFTDKEPCQLLVGTAKNDGLMEKMWYGVLTQYKSLALKYAKSELFKV